MIFKRKVLAISVTAAVLGLAACGLTPQDGGSQSNSPQLSGRVIDGYIAGGVAYVDTNDNNKLDSWETRALTDSDGFFTYNPKTKTYYCGTDNAEYEQYCLKAPGGSSLTEGILVKITKGIDLTTMEPFSGTLNIRYGVEYGAVENMTAVTPLSALFSHLDRWIWVDVAEDEFGYSPEDVLMVLEDFMDFENTDSQLTGGDWTDAKRKLAIALTQRIHKIADLIGGRLNVKFDQKVLANPGDNSLTAKGFFGYADGIGNDPADLIYAAIASKVTSTLSVTPLLSNQTHLEAIVTAAWANFNAEVEKYNTDNPSKTQYKTVTVDTAAVTAIAADALAVSQLVDSLFAGDLAVSGSSSVAEDAASRMRALDVAASMMRDGKTSDSLEVINAITMAKDVTYLQNLRSEATDVAGLKEKFVKGGGSVAAADADYSNRKSFLDLIAEASTGNNKKGWTPTNLIGLGGNSVSITDDNKTKDDVTDDSTVAITFKGDGAVTSGVLEVSATLTSGFLAAKKNDSGLEAGKTDLVGNWQLVNPYTLIMNIEIVKGVNQVIILKPTVVDDGNALTDDTAYYFSIGNEQKIWKP